jgi:protein involved in polysaccharide export with SLBB domain
VRFFHTPEQNVVLPVRPDGLISLPLAYEVRAAGRTVEELRAELVQRCSRELASPEVAVIVRRFAPDQIHVGGEVGRPGLFELQAGRTVLQAVMQAGGFLPTASPEDVLIVRAAERGYRVIPVDLQDVLDGVDASGNMVLRPFDVVFVPSSPIANVNKWVDQYIRKNIPINISYRLDDLVDDDDD